MPDEPLDLDALQALCEDASAPDWVHAYEGDRRHSIVIDGDGEQVASCHLPDDAAFIAAARAALPALIARVRELEARLAEHG